MEGKADFNGTIKWNRTNPWLTGSMLDTTKGFAYPLTCCPINKVQQNWNNLPLDQLQQATNCALYGNNVYEVVRLFIIKISKIEI